MTAAVDRSQRFTTARPCPICGGGENQARGRGERCAGFLGSDGLYAHCSREEYAAGMEQGPDGLYAHRLAGYCHCGLEHGTARPVSARSPTRSQTVTYAVTNGHKPAAGTRALPLSQRPRAAVYPYHDAAGRLVFEVVRFEPKDFRPRMPRPGQRPEPFAWALPPADQLVLYRLPELRDTPVETAVLVVEGEKDVDRLRGLGFVATTNQGGAGKWEPAYTEQLTGRPVIIIPDNDPAGEAHAQKVAAALYGAAAGVWLLRLPGLPPKGDVSDWLGAGGTAEELERLCAAAPEWQPDIAVRFEPQPPPAAVEVWPAPPADAAYYGLAGAFVEQLAPHTEADPVALLAQFLVGFGSLAGRGAYFTAEAAQHHTNLYVVLVGETAVGRKGSSWAQVRRLLAEVDPGWQSERIVQGQSSGEGLIWAVRDPIKAGDSVTDPGISDKRLLAAESEFATVLRVLEREGSTLSAVLRQAWESGSLRALTKNSQAKASGAHISEIGHITPDELRRYLLRTEVANGLGNRFLWLCVRRARLLPDGDDASRVDLSALAESLRQAAVFAGEPRLLSRDAEARALWHERYASLARGGNGMAGALTSRAEAQVMRLALVYAVLDLSERIRRPHLEAALALWQYGVDSVRQLFGSSVGDPVADVILASVRAAPEGLTRWEISKLFSGNRSADELSGALALLTGRGLLRTDVVRTGGRPAERFICSEENPA